ncbi:hypothetical protein QQF64_031399 [Cirrhinus molitorella]|uniref:Secreted protein n=1 Tax=Cirrhinus molitorella TaxID=172907 RepID=A0ABR3MX07_9TELE
MFWRFSRSRATVKSQWALAALFQRIKMNNSFPETTNVLFSRTGPSQSSVGSAPFAPNGEGFVLEFWTASRCFWPKQRCFTFSIGTVPGNPTFTQWLFYTNTELGLRD